MKPLNKKEIFDWICLNVNVYTHEGLDMLRPLRTKLYFLNWICFFRFMVYCLFFRTSIQDVDFKEHEIPFFYGEYVVKQKSTKEIYNVFLGQSSGIFVPVLVKSCFCFYLFPAKFLMLLFIYLSKPGGWFSFVASMAYVRSYFDYSTVKHCFRKIENRKVFTYCDAIGAENLIAQYANSKGVVTYTLQHGQYRTLELSNFSEDIEAINNFVSDYLLCWGKATVDEFIKFGFSPRKFICVGRFMRRGAVKRSNFLLNESSCFTVALSGNNSKKHNYELLKFANYISDKFNIKYKVKYHPKNDKYEYCSYLSASCLGDIDNDDYYSEACFTIMAMSGLFVQCIYNRHLFFILNVSGLSGVYKELLPIADYSFNPLVDFSNLVDFEYLEAMFDDYTHQKEFFDELRGMIHEF